MARERPDDDDIDDDAPWLAEGVRERRGSTMVPRGRIIGGGVFVLALLILIGLGIYVISGRKQDGSTGFKTPEEAPLIAADTGPYKLAPTDPGGAAVTGIDDSIAAAGRGDTPGSAIDTTTMPEEPVARPGAGAGPPPTDLLPPAATAVPPATVRQEPPPAALKPIPAPPVLAPTAPKLIPAPKATVEPAKPPEARPARPEPGKPEPAKPETTRPDTPRSGTPRSGTVSLQLGAFSTEAKADAAWTAATERGPILAGLTKRVEPLDRDGRTLYRLRATGVASKAAATELCAKVKAGGDPCLVAE